MPVGGAQISTVEDDDEEEDYEAIVIDNGSYWMKAGFGGDDAPRAVFPTIVGRVRFTGMVGMGQKDAYVGDEAQAKRGILSIKRSIEKGIISNWDDMEKIWHHTFYNELRIAPEEHPVLLTDTYNIDASAANTESRHRWYHPATMYHRERMTQIMFETFNVPRFYIEDQGILTLYASGRVTGIAIDFGYQNTRIKPIYQGHILKDVCDKLDIGGFDITGYLQKLLDKNRGYKLTTSYERECLRDIKEKFGYISLDFENEKAEEKIYELPDGSVLTIGNERFECAECLFKPELIEKDAKDLGQTVRNCLNNFDDKDLKEVMTNNIVLSGGNSMLHNLGERLKQELSINDEIKECKIIDPPERKYSVWIGASILASLSTFSNLYINKDEYDEYGPTSVHIHCF